MNGWMKVLRSRFIFFLGWISPFLFTTRPQPLLSSIRQASLVAQPTEAGAAHERREQLHLSHQLFQQSARIQHQREQLCFAPGPNCR